MIGGLLRLAFSLILASAAAHAARDLPGFAAIVANYRLAPLWASRAVAWALPPLQLLAAVLLLVWPPAGCSLALALLALFTAAIAINVARGRTAIECGCGGAAGQLLSPALVLRNLVLVLLLAVAAAAPPAAPHDAASLVGMAGAAGFLVVTYFAAGQMIANRDRLAAGGRA
jgi:hypothetical protein